MKTTPVCTRKSIFLVPQAAEQSQGSRLEPGDTASQLLVTSQAPWEHRASFFPPKNVYSLIYMIRQGIRHSQTCSAGHRVTALPSAGQSPQEAPGRTPLPQHYPPGLPSSSAAERGLGTARDLASGQQWVDSMELQPMAPALPQPRKNWERNGVAFKCQGCLVPSLYLPPTSFPPQVFVCFAIKPQQWWVSVYLAQNESP